MRENHLTQDIRFNPHRVRAAGLASVVEAKILRYFWQNGAQERRTVLRIFDARMLQKLERMGLVQSENGIWHLTDEGREVLERCTEASNADVSAGAG